MASIIRAANSYGVPILALDLPSGLRPNDWCPLRTLHRSESNNYSSSPQDQGSLAPKAKKYVGELYLADISIPPEVYETYSQPSGLFDADSLAESGNRFAATLRDLCPNLTGSWVGRDHRVRKSCEVWPTASHRADSLTIWD